MNKIVSALVMGSLLAAAVAAPAALARDGDGPNSAVQPLYLLVLFGLGLLAADQLTNDDKPKST